MGGVGDQDDIVLIGTEKAEALRRQDAEDAEGEIADAQSLADGVFVGEHLIDDGFSDDADLGEGFDLLIREHGAGCDGPVADIGVVGTDAVDVGAPVQTIGEDLFSRAHLGAEAVDIFDIGEDGVGVFRREGSRAAVAAPRAAAGEAARHDGDQILAHRGDLGFDLGFGPVADADHRNDGGDADDHAQRGEHRAHGIAAEGAKGDEEGAGKSHGGYVLSVGRRW